MHLTATDVAALALAGVAAGAINAAAGGGSLISFPTLVAIGYPPITANVTNTVALCPGYLGGTAGYRRELRGQRTRIVRLGVVSIAGGIGGAVLLNHTSQFAFKIVAPVLVLFSCVLLAIQPLVTRRLREPRTPGGERPALYAAQLPAAAYGAYFGAGLGVVVLAILAIFVDDTLQRLNALKGLMSLVINVVAAAYFIAFLPVRWQAVLVLAPASLVGGRAGVFAARRVSDRVLRAVVVVFGVAAATYLFTKV